MELRTRKIPKKKKLCLVPLGDIQYDSDPSHSALGRLKQDIDEALALEDQGYTVLFGGHGDFIDFVSPSNRMKIEAAHLYETALSVMEDAALKLVDNLYENYLKKTRGKWAYFCEGHHFFQLSNGLTTDQYLAAKLGCDKDFLGTTGMVKFVAGDKPEEQLEVWAAHGLGSGILAGSFINRLERIANWVNGADCYIMGHCTRRGAVPLADLLRKPGTDELTDNCPFLIGSGGYSRGYIERHREGLTPRGTYVEKRLLRPVALGCCYVFWTPGIKPPRVLV